MQVKALATGFGSSSSSYFPLFLFSLNIFDFNNETQQLQCNLKHTEHFNIKQGDVKKAFHFVKANKFHGPANSCCHLLNNGVLYSIIFLKSLYRHTTHLLFWRMLFYCLLLRLVIPKFKKNKFSCSHIGCDESSETCEVRDFKANWTCAWPPL